jgi:sarcosine oxidase subunit delta
MMILDCPWCGKRPETEFHCGAEAAPPRPRNPEQLSDEAWVDWLTNRRNPRGPMQERWWHQRGCGLWFTIRRDTATHEVLTPEDGAA